jgi:hypothetical protein
VERARYVVAAHVAELDSQQTVTPPFRVKLNTVPALINGEVIRGWDAYREKQRQWWDDGRAVGSYDALGEPVYEALGEDSGLTTLSSWPDGGHCPTVNSANDIWPSQRYGASGPRGLAYHLRPRIQHAIAEGIERTGLVQVNHSCHDRPFLPYLLVGTNGV